MKQFLIEAAKFWDGQLARLDYITTTGVSRASRRECPARVRCCRTAGQRADTKETQLFPRYPTTCAAKAAPLQTSTYPATIQP